MKKQINELATIIEESEALTERKKRTSGQRRKSKAARKKRISKSMVAKEATPEQKALIGRIGNVVRGKERQVEELLAIGWDHDDFPADGTGRVEIFDDSVWMGGGAKADDKSEAGYVDHEGSEIDVQVVAEIGPHRNGKDLFVYTGWSVEVIEEGDEPPTILGEDDFDITVKIPAKKAARVTSIGSLEKILPIEKLGNIPSIRFPDWDEIKRDDDERMDRDAEREMDDGDARYDAWKDAGKPSGGPGRYRY